MPARIRGPPPISRCRSIGTCSRSRSSRWSGWAEASLATRSRAKLSPLSTIARTAMACRPVEIGQPIRGGVIRPAQPERLEAPADRPVGMGGLRLDPGADDIADQAVHRRRNPRVVPRIAPGPPRRRGRARQDRRVQPVDRPRPLPTPSATRSIEAASACEAEMAMEDGPHGRENRPKRTLKLLGMFGRH
jgi:hypothetical protein